MIEVLAVIRMNMVNKTKRALSDAGISSMTAKEALGRGKGSVDFTLLQGAERGYQEAIAHLGQSDHLVPNRALTIVVPDELLSRVVDTIVATNQTGKHGDGKIFVLPVLEAIRIRPSELNEPVLDEG